MVLAALPLRRPELARRLSAVLALGCAVGGALALGAVGPFGAPAWWALAGLACGGVFAGLCRQAYHLALAERDARLAQAQQELQKLRVALKTQEEALADAQAQTQTAVNQWQDALKALQVQHRDLLDAHAEVAALSETETRAALGSRRALEERLNRIVHAMGERRAQAPRHAFLRIDVDDVAGLNARWGRHVGDFVISVVSTRLALAQREGDLLVRWGGETFLSLIPADDAEAARACAERLRLAVAAHPVALPWGELQAVTVSIGYACWPFTPERALGWQEALQVAEWALQQARVGGSNRSVGCVPTGAGLPAEAGDAPVDRARVAQWAAAALLRTQT